MTNKELADHLRSLQVFLTIAGYDEMFARRYLHIASEVEDLEEPVEEMWREGRLREIQGVGPSTAESIGEILESGMCAKQEEWEKVVPFSVTELVRLPGLGVKTARRLYLEHGITSLETLGNALDEGRLSDAAGLGERTLARWAEALKRRVN